MSRPESSAAADSQRRANQRLGWILFTIALTFGLGFVAKIALFNH